MTEPTTSDLLEFYTETKARLKTLEAEVEQAESILAGISEIVMERMPPEADAMNHTTTSGAKLKLTRKETERHQPKGGQSDDFWAWVKENRRWDMASRTVLQAGVKQYEADHGVLPPHIERVVTSKLNITVTFPAPKA